MICTYMMLFELDAYVFCHLFYLLKQISTSLPWTSNEFICAVDIFDFAIFHV